MNQTQCGHSRVKSERADLAVGTVVVWVCTTCSQRFEPTPSKVEFIQAKALEYKQRNSVLEDELNKSTGNICTICYARNTEPSAHPCISCKFNSIALAKEEYPGQLESQWRTGEVRTSNEKRRRTTGSM